MTFQKSLTFLKATSCVSGTNPSILEWSPVYTEGARCHQSGEAKWTTYTEGARCHQSGEAKWTKTDLDLAAFHKVDDFLKSTTFLCRRLS